MEEPTSEPAPIACSLSSASLRDRETEWATLAATSLRKKVPTTSGVRLEFEPDHDTTHQLLDLVIAERECCAWAAWDLTHTAAATTLNVTAEGEGARVLQQMFEVA